MQPTLQCLVIQVALLSQSRAVLQRCLVQVSRLQRYIFLICTAVPIMYCCNMQSCWCRYKSWSEAVGKATASVAVLYSSDYGYSDRLSQTLARGITKAGVATEMVDVLNIDTQVGSTQLCVRGFGESLLCVNMMHSNI